MKIKSDLITNSSSTSYVVYIPDNFNIREYTKYPDDKDFDFELFKTLDDLISCGSKIISNEDYDLKQVIKIFEERNLILDILHEVTFHSIIIGITEKQINKLKENSKD